MNKEKITTLKNRFWDKITKIEKMKEHLEKLENIHKRLHLKAGQSTVSIKVDDIILQVTELDGYYCSKQVDSMEIVLLGLKKYISLKIEIEKQKIKEESELLDNICQQIKNLVIDDK